MTSNTTPEQSDLTLGFVPLLDCAPLIAAHELGYFECQGLNVRLQKEGSWASLRDKLMVGLLDGAHLLAPMVLASHLGKASTRVSPLTTALALGQNGNALTFSNDLVEQMGKPEPGNLEAVTKGLARAAERRIMEGKPLIFGTVYPFSIHTNLLRLLFRKAGLTLNQDVSIQVVPPTRMVSALANQEVDGYCVGEPWNSAAASCGQGQLLLLGSDLWPQAPDKVFGVSEDFSASAPKSHASLVRALMQACQWLDQPDRTATLAHWLAQPHYLDCSSDLLLRAMQTPWRDGLPRWRKIFFRDFASYPFHSHGRWLLEQLLVQDQLPLNGIDRTSLLERAYNKTLWEEVAQQAGLELPVTAPPVPD